jgi:hypothetical protein
MRSIRPAQPLIIKATASDLTAITLGGAGDIAFTGVSKGAQQVEFPMDPYELLSVAPPGFIGKRSHLKEAHNETIQNRYRTIRADESCL